LDKLAAGIISSVFCCGRCGEVCDDQTSARNQKRYASRDHADFHTLTGTLDSGGSGRTFVCLFKERFQQQSANTNK